MTQKKQKIYCITTSLTDPNAFFKIGQTHEIESRMRTYHCCNPNSCVLGIKDGDRFDESLRHFRLSRDSKICKIPSCFGQHVDEWYITSKENVLNIFNKSNLELSNELWNCKNNWNLINPDKAKSQLKDYINYVINNSEDLSELFKNNKGELDKVHSFLMGFIQSKDRSKYLVNSKFDSICIQFLPKDIKSNYLFWEGSRTLNGIPTNEICKGAKRGMEDLIKDTIDKIEKE